MKKLFIIFCFSCSLILPAQTKVPKTEYADYTLVELLDKTTKKYKEPMLGNNAVIFDYVNKKITASDTANNLRNIYIIKDFKMEKTAKTYTCTDFNSKMDCTVQTFSKGKQKIMEIVFVNGFKIRFSKP